MLKKTKKTTENPEAGKKTKTNTHPKVGGGEAVRRGGGGGGGGGRVSEVGVDVGEQAAHHGGHAGTHVFGRQTGEMPAEENKQLSAYCKCLRESKRNAFILSLPRNRRGPHEEILH